MAPVEDAASVSSGPICRLSFLVKRADRSSCLGRRHDHVIDRQQGRWYGHHSFHFNHGLPNSLCGHQAMDSLRLFIDCEFDRHRSQTDGMTEGDDVAGLLGCHNASHSRNP